MSKKIDMKLADIQPNPKQPRKDFPEEGLRELAENIKQVGLKQPLIVRPLGNGKYQLVDGERRYRACKLIPSLEDVPVDIREDIKTEEDAAIQSYIMNEQRLNYNPQDKEAYIYHLKESTGLSTRKLAEKLGVHHSHVDHLLEAYDFRQRLPPTEVGTTTTLSLSHTALKNTAMIKDDRLRMRMLQAIQDKKLKNNYGMIKDISSLLEVVPREVQEAYFLELLDLPALAEIAEDARRKGWGVVMDKVFSEGIPIELKRDVLHSYPYLQAATNPDLFKDLIDREEKRKEAWLQQYLKEHPERSEKEIRQLHHMETYDWKDEWKAFVQWQLHDFKKRYEHYAKEYHGGSYYSSHFWVDVFYWMNQLKSISRTNHIKDDEEDFRIAIIDAVYCYDNLKVFRAQSKNSWLYEKARETEEGIEEEITEEDMDAVEKAANARAIAKRKEIEAKMQLGGQEEETKQK